MTQMYFYKYIVTLKTNTKITQQGAEFQISTIQYMINRIPTFSVGDNKPANLLKLFFCFVLESTEYIDQ